MSRLNFAPLGDAFLLGSKQIQDTQDEIARLKELVIQSNRPSEEKLSGPSPIPPAPAPAPAPAPEQNYQRIGPPPSQVATFTNSQVVNDLIDQLIQTPRFQDIVKKAANSNYANYTLQSVKETFGSSETKNLLIFILIILTVYLFFNLF